MSNDTEYWFTRFFKWAVRRVWRLATRLCILPVWLLIIALRGLVYHLKRPLGGAPEAAGRDHARAVLRLSPKEVPGGAHWRHLCGKRNESVSEGICCSGGGIRSASYNLGALQVLRSQGVVQQSDYIAGVSGGGYIAIAHAITEANSDQHLAENDPFWGRLSPEEDYLRNNTDYLAAGARGRVWLAMHVLGGFIVNGLVIAAMLYVLARPLGWISGGVQRGIASADRNGTAAFRWSTGWGWFVIAAAVAFSVFVAFTWRVRWQLQRRRVAPEGEPRRQDWVIRLGFAAGLGTLAVLIGEPLWWLANRPGLSATKLSYDTKGNIVHPVLPRNTITVNRWLVIAVLAPFGVALVLAGLSYLMARLRKWEAEMLNVARHWTYWATLLALLVFLIVFGLPLAIVGLRWLVEQAKGGSFVAHSPKSSLLSTAVAIAGVGVAGFIAVYRFLRGNGRFAVPFVAVLLGPVLLLALVTVFASGSASLGASQYWLIWVCLVAGLVSMQLLVDSNAWALHRFYRQQLWGAFAIKRTTNTGDGKIEIKCLSMDETKKVDTTGHLSAREKVRLSELSTPRFPALVICTAMNVAGDCVPPGRGAVSLTFEHDNCRTILSGPVDSSTYEDWAERSVPLTLPALMALSGAALAPDMGKSGYRGSRTLFAMLNVRLGLWLPNPCRPDIWKTETADTDRDVWRHVFARWLRRALLSPGPFSLVREALGLTSVNSRYVYVTDGGHWENLGLVELLRRGCNVIYCVDASGDALSTFDTLGEAIALARTELGVEIDVDPRQLQPEPGDKPAKVGFVIGHYVFPDKSDGLLVYMKTTLFENTPWDVKASASRNKSFPCDSTLQQVFDDEKFEAYRALGAAAANDAMVGLGRHLQKCKHGCCKELSYRFFERTSSLQLLASTSDDVEAVPQADANS